MRREKLEPLMTTGMIKGSRRKQQEKMLNGLTIYVGQVTYALEAMKGRDALRIIFIYTCKECAA